MTSRLLVLHGPDLLRLGRGSLASQPSLDGLDAALDFAATAAGLELRCARGAESELVRAVDEAAGWATHALVSPGALAPTAWLLRAALAFHALPYGEVFLESLPDSDDHRRRSVLESQAQVRRRGPANSVYAEAAEKLLGVRFAAVPPGLAGKAAALANGSPRQEPKPMPAPPSRAPEPTAAPTPKAPSKAPPTSRPAAPAKMALGRARPAETSGKPPSNKTIGRKARDTEPDRASGSRPEPSRGVTRAMVRQRVADRLSGRISAAQLATWGREQWLTVERGGPTEAGQRELLSEALQSLALSSTPSMTLSEPELLDLMARMG